MRLVRTFTFAASQRHPIKSKRRNLSTCTTTTPLTGLTSCGDSVCTKRGFPLESSFEGLNLNTCCDIRSTTDGCVDSGSHRKPDTDFPGSSRTTATTVLSTTSRNCDTLIDLNENISAVTGLSGLPLSSESRSRSSPISSRRKLLDNYKHSLYCDSLISNYKALNHLNYHLSTNNSIGCAPVTKLGNRARNSINLLPPSRQLSTLVVEPAKRSQEVRVERSDSGRSEAGRSSLSQKVDVRRLMAAEEEWITAGRHRLHAWSVSGMESCIVAHIAGNRLAFDMGHATRPSIQCAHVFISHGHIDHVGALLKHAAHRSLFSLPPATYYVPPHLVEPLRNMAASVSQLHGSDEKFCDLNIKAVSAGETVQVTKSISVSAFPTIHRVPSQGYIVYCTEKRLKAEYAGLPGPEIGALVKDGVNVNELVTVPELAYTGDTTFDVFRKPPTPDLLRVRTLVTESTYIDDERDRQGRGGVQRARDRGHSHIQEMVDAEQLFEKVEHIVLVHFSDKYSVRYIQRRTHELLTESLRRKVALGITLKQTLG